jgi:threonyl-tRNA synthetase
VEKELKDAGIRVELDSRNEKVGYKIRDWEVHKVPYMLVVGEKEQQQHRISVRKHKEGDLGALDIDSFVKDIRNKIDNRL